MEPLELGLILGGASDAAAWTRTFAAVERAEALGLHSVWLPEGHFAPGATPSPLVALAAFAARSRRIRLGTTSLLVSIHHPLHVAEETAAVDLLSGGRLLLGLGRGFRAPVFRGFEVEASAKRDRFDEALDAILSAWSGEPVALASAHFETRARAVRPALRPLQHPHPPLYVAAFGRKGLQQAARRGLPYLASPLETLSRLAENFAYHEDALVRPLAPGPHRAPVIRTVHVAADDAEAVRALTGMEREARRIGAGLRGALARAAAGPVSERVLIGTTAQVADQLGLYRERLGLDLLIARTQVPGVAPEEQHASLDRLVHDVLPHST